MAQLAAQRELTLPVTALRYSELRGRLLRFSEESAENRRIAQDLLFGLENSYKAYYGLLFALNDDAFMAAKARDEAALRANPAARQALAPAAAPIPRAPLSAAPQQQRARYTPQTSQ